MSSLSPVPPVDPYSPTLGELHVEVSGCLQCSVHVLHILCTYAGTCITCFVYIYMYMYMYYMFCVHLHVHVHVQVHVHIFMYMYMLSMYSYSCTCIACVQLYMYNYDDVHVDMIRV